MLELPRSTEFNKRIPKQRFYENLQITPALRKCFVEQIHSITWRNKIAPSTTNLVAGKNVDELQVFSILLNNGKLDEAVLKQIDREIPYHILFLLEYEGKVQAWIGYKEEAGSGTAAFKVNQYYHTDWLAPEDLAIEGLNMDAVYEGFVKQVSAGILDADITITLKEAYNKSVQKEKTQKKIAILQGKIRNERQLNRQIQMNAELKALKKELEEL